MRICFFAIFRFHTYNGTRPSESVPTGTPLAEDVLFARPPDPRNPRVTKICIYYKINMTLMQHII